MNLNLRRQSSKVDWYDDVENCIPDQVKQEKIDEGFGSF